MKQISRNVWFFGLILVTLLLAACSDPTKSDPATTANPTATVPAIITTPTVHPTNTAPSPTSVSGSGRTISMSDNGKTINLKVNEHVLIWLETTGVDDTWYWSVVEGDHSIVHSIESAAIPRGSQGYIQAFKTGKTTLTGTPTCFKSQPSCTLPSSSFKAEIVVS